MGMAGRSVMITATATATATIMNMIMITTTPTATTMTTDVDLLALTQWLSPSFPVGSYAYSQGLETAIADGDVTSEVDLQAWLATTLRTGTLFSDAVVLAAALVSDADHDRLSMEALARAGSKTRRTEMLEQGRAFADAQAALGEGPVPHHAFPVAVGRAAARLSVPADRVVALYLQSLVSSLAIGAVRHIPLGQSAGQRIIAALSPDILRAANVALRTSLDDLALATPGADLAAMRQETLEVRIFRS